MEQRPICPNCRAFISRADRVCPYCEFELSPSRGSSVDATRAISGLLPQNGQLTNYILGINIFLYLACVLFDGQNGGGGGLFSSPSSTALLVFGAKEPTFIFTYGQWGRLVTAGFLHASLMHIIMNSFGLYDLGAQVEDSFGSGKMLVIYVLSSIAGFFASAVFAPSISIGASAAIFGLIGAMIAFGVHERSRFGGMVKSAYTRTAIWALLISFLIPYTDNWAHIGGLAGGFVAGYVVGHPAFSQPRQERYWNIAGLGMALFVALCFVLRLMESLRALRS